MIRKCTKCKTMYHKVLRDNCPTCGFYPKSTMFPKAGFHRPEIIQIVKEYTNNGMS